MPTHSPTPAPPTFSPSPCLDISNASNIVIEWKRIGPCPGDHGIHIYNSSNITIRNVIIEGAMTGIATLDSDHINVDGNVTITGPLGPYTTHAGEGQCVQFDKQFVGVIRGVTCRASGAPADLIASYMSQYILIENNEAGGGSENSGCAYIVDGTNNANVTIRNNVAYDTVNCGIGIANGTGILVEANQVLDRNGNGQACEVRSDGLDPSCIYVWNQYPSPCDNIRILNNFVTPSEPNKFWNAGNCTNVTASGNNWN